MQLERPSLRPGAGLPSDGFVQADTTSLVTEMFLAPLRAGPWPGKIGSGKGSYEGLGP